MGTLQIPLGPKVESGVVFVLHILLTSVRVKGNMNLSSRGRVVGGHYPASNQSGKGT